MRVIAGTARGRRIEAPPGTGTRPITDRAKESIFNMLVSLGAIVDAEVVDLYAGSGSFGIECLSRGAARVTFVERARAAGATIEANLARLDFADRATVEVGPVERALDRLPSADLAFCDPPYGSDVWPDLLSRLDAEIVVGHAERDIPLPAGWEELRRRTYGRSHIVIARRLTPLPTADRGTG
ncbi:MAG: RsmD family RNA methyltransferase [Acidimicrobiia bacterium]|nr:RsmD family RNA methyltransferase [Acidimicrobiia bacterium]